MKFDGRVTIAMIVALALQAGGGLVWAGRAAARMDDMEARLEAQRPVAERLASLEAQMRLAQKSLDRIERRLDAK
jgi:type VI protein secretion system component VasK